MNASSAAHPWKRLRLTRFAALTAATTIAAACASDAPLALSGGTGDARMSVINGTRGAVRVTVDGNVRINALPAASISSAIDLPAGEHTVELQAVGGGALSGVASTKVSARADGTAFVAAHSSALGTLLAGVVGDTGAVPASGLSKLRVIHLAAAAGALDVWRTQPGYPTPIRTMFPFPYAAESSFLQSTPGEWEVIVTAASAPASGEPDPRPLALARLALSIGPDLARTVVILDKPGGGVVISVLSGN